jgi:hypothetical protein
MTGFNACLFILSVECDKALLYDGHRSGGFQPPTFPRRLEATATSRKRFSHRQFPRRVSQAVSRGSK